MNEFEWRRQLRDLRQPQTPRRDLWSGIEQALEPARPVACAHPRRQPFATWLLAASLAAVSVLAVGLSGHAALHPTSAMPGAWKPSDPRLAGAAVELDAAQLELRQALQQAPASPALRRLLSRTERQQSRLRLFEHQAG